MDMDMDIGWCLTCSKRTSDPRIPYCSDACRVQDNDSNVFSISPRVISSPLPPKLVLPLPPSPTLNAVSKTNNNISESKPNLARAPLAAIPTASLASEPLTRGRDRRAFSFPAFNQPSEETQRPSMLPFTRKANPIVMNAPVRPYGKSKRIGRLSQDIARAYQSTGGANTPNVQQSAVFATSGSESGKKSPALRTQRLASTSCIPTSPPQPMTRISPALPTSGATSMSSHLQTARPSLDPRRASQSPVATLIGASSSSRSREDIISWARAVGFRPSEEGSTEQSEEDISPTSSPRGRSRTRRPSAQNNPTSLSSEAVDDAPGTTPKGTGPFGALNMSFGVGPFVKAFRSVKAAASPTGEAQVSALGLQSVPAPAEVSFIDVVVATHQGESEVPVLANGGATPTLSTISFSEAIDLSTTDAGETYDTVDDRSTSSYAHGSIGAIRSKSKGLPPQRTKSPLKPISSTASVIWNLSTYLRSLAPFSAPFAISSALTPVTAPSTTSLVASESDSQSPLKAPVPDLRRTSPMPAVVRLESHPEDDSDIDQDGDVGVTQDLVRSIPMDIVLPLGSKAHALIEERQREREAMEFLGPRSRSRTRVEASRTPSPSPSKRGSLAPDVPVALTTKSTITPTRQPFNDPDKDDEGHDARRGRRGRSPRGNKTPLLAKIDLPVDSPDEHISGPGADSSRGRRRDRVGESRDRSWSAARGRQSRSGRRDSRVC